MDTSLNVGRDSVEERLRAYMWPNRAQTEEEEEALERAIDAQLAYESGGDLANLPAGTAAFSIGNYSVTLREAAGAALTQNNICPAAWAILYNAGLLRRRWPVAKRL